VTFDVGLITITFVFLSSINYIAYLCNQRVQLKYLVLLSILISFGILLLRQLLHCLDCSSSSTSPSSRISIVYTSIFLLKTRSFVCSLIHCYHLVQNRAPASLPSGLTSEPLISGLLLPPDVQTTLSFCEEPAYQDF
jgi:hypothetical protein